MIVQPTASTGVSSKKSRRSFMLRTIAAIA